MEIIIHQVNKIENLKNIPTKYGVEIDVRTDGSKIILNHDPLNGGDVLRDYLENYFHGTIVFNIKEAGIETSVLDLAKEFKIKSFFLLDVEMPFLFNSAKNNQKNVAVRFSEYESIELSKYFINSLDWMWIDTVSTLPINDENKKILSYFKTCLVCPERWGRKQDIGNYKKILKSNQIYLDAVMTSLECSGEWL